MGKKLFLSVAASAILASPAWAQYTASPLSGSGTGGNSVTFATELFGSGGNATTLTIDSATRVDLAADLSSNAVSAQRTADIRFCLDGGAQFAADVSGLDVLEAGSTVVPGTATTAIATNGGGRAGDSCVTYTVTAVQALNDSATIFRFAPPNVMNAGFLGTVSESGPTPLNVTVTLIPNNLGAPPASTGFPAFPASNTAEGGDKIAIATSTPRYGLAVDFATDQRVLVDLADRTMFASREGDATYNPRVVTITGIGDADRMGIELSKVMVTGYRANNAMGGLHQPATGASGDKVEVSVTSSGMSFTDADMLFLSTDTNYQESSDIRLTASGRTASSSALELATTVPYDQPNSRVGTGDGAQYTLYYVPAPDRALMRDTTFMSTYAISFANAGYKDDVMMAAMGGVTLELAGLSTRGYAYAIPHDMANDEANLRIRCEDTSACTVFLECSDMAGSPVGAGGGFVGIDPIEPMASMRLSSADLVETLGEWQGRISCEIVASGPVGVQLLTRNKASGTLVNNTYISRQAAPASN